MTSICKETTKEGGGELFNKHLGLGIQDGESKIVSQILSRLGFPRCLLVISEILNKSASFLSKLCLID